MDLGERVKGFPRLIQTLGLSLVNEVRPAAVHSHTVAKIGKRSFQPYRETGLFGEIAVFGVDECPPAQGNDRFWRGG
jgi:hypothetical protein